jgi:hypothetical protein
MPAFLPPPPQGVTFYDEQQREWAVLEARGRRTPLRSSPLAAAHTFALFDEARCRGSDLALRGDAVGLLTLGAGATKDKVMQVREGKRAVSARKRPEQ